jgi:hypothetical protein
LCQTDATLDAFEEYLNYRNQKQIEYIAMTEKFYSRQRQMTYVNILKSSRLKDYNYCIQFCICCAVLQFVRKTKELQSYVPAETMKSAQNDIEFVTETTVKEFLLLREGFLKISELVAK